MIACVCGKPARDAYLCKACSHRLEKALGDLPALLEDLDTTLARQAVIGPQAEGKAAETPSPIHIAAGAVASDVRYKLATSVRYLAEVRRIPDLPADNPTTMARWLLTHHDSIRLDPAGPDIARDIHACTSAIMSVIDLPTTRGRFKVGMCPELSEDGSPCPGEVWVHLPAEDLDESPSMACRRCRREWGTSEWNRAGRRILQRGNAA